ncbi:RsmE family RNA methyltransferase [Chloroflexota bacterium]
MHRFFIPGDWILGNSVLIKGEQARQIHEVLRIKPGSRLSVLDNTGWEYDIEVQITGNELVQGSVVGRERGKGEPSLKITLYQALLKSDKFEIVLQKGVELGVNTFVPFISERCVVTKPGDSKIKRWEKIIQEAAEQSGRNLLPVLQPVVSFVEACKTLSSPSILLWEEEKTTKLRDILGTAPYRDSPAINLFIGPEGGYSAPEAEYARVRGITTASLGQRLLRAETAGIAVVTAVLYDRRELG